MKYLIDTNIISELRRRPKCDASVSAWYETVADDELYLSALVLGEIRKGVERALAADPPKAAALEAWLRQIEIAFAGRVLGIDSDVVEHWGRMSAVRSVPVVDCPLAATAAAHGLTLVTRPDAGHAQ